MVMEIIISVLLLFIGIAILVIIHICIVGRAFSRSFGSDGVPIIIKGAGMSIHDLKKLPCFEYKQQAEKQTANAAATIIIDCAVCLDSFAVGDCCRWLPNCQHYFHAQCVDVWLAKSPFCPVCRTCTVVNPNVSPKLLAFNGGTTTNNVAEEMC